MKNKILVLLLITFVSCAITKDIIISTILFDKSKNYGVLSCGFGTGNLMGLGYQTLIRNDKNNIWVIDKIIFTTLS